jgi:hypothetical protein
LPEVPHPTPPSLTIAKRGNVEEYLTKGQPFCYSRARFHSGGEIRASSFLRTSSELPQNFLRTSSELSQNFLRTSSELPQNFLRTKKSLSLELILPSKLLLVNFLDIIKGTRSQRSVPR